MQMNPPVRGPSHRDAIWRGLDQGVVDVLGSDHAPHTLEEKAKPYPESPSGMTGVQTLVPIMLDHVNAGRLSLAALRRSDQRRAAAPLRHHRQGPHRGGLRRRPHHRRSRSAARRSAIRGSPRARGWTPYDGRTVTGWPVGTFVRGRRVMWEGELDSAVDGGGGAVCVSHRACERHLISVCFNRMVWSRCLF